MISIDGIEIPKVVSIECNHDTGFLTFIRFYVDSRIDGCIDLDKLEKYNPVQIQEQTSEEVGVYQVILNLDTEIGFST